MNGAEREMAGVVLRCPTCGTTQNHSGECEACSEGEVRYFCSNHSPGLWLDEPVCNGCGAKFGEARRKPPEPKPRAAPTAPTRARSRTAFRPAMPRGTEPPDTPPRRPPPRVADPEDVPSIPSLADVLVELLEEGKRTRDTVEEVPWREPIATAPRRPFPILGCLTRLALLVLLLIAFAVGALFVLFGGVVY